MPVAHDADPWVRPPLGGRENAWHYGVARDGPGPQADVSFADFVDILNPLQHVPLVSSLYRELTGDEIQPAAKVMGATLFGGPIGFMAATNLAVIQQAAGNSPADLLVAALMDGDGPRDAQTIAQVEAAQVEAAQIDGTQANDMPLPASGASPGGAAAGPSSADTERQPWPWTKRSERDPPTQGTGWTQNWQSQPRDAAAYMAANTATPAAGLQVAAAPVGIEPADGAGFGEATWAGPATFLPLRRVK